MTNTYQEIAKTIRSNAKKILESKNIDSTIRKMGDLFYTGSYALDLMTWNDIDMQIVLKEDVNPMEALSSLFNFFVKDPDFIEAQMIHFHGNFKPHIPHSFIY